MDKEVRVRIGPSPTGDPHVGTAYITLFNSIFAKQRNGKVVLRIEDTDRTRSKPEWEDMICDSLKWLGLNWDEGPDCGGPFGPYRQSERGEIYKKYADELLEKGAAYHCFCSSEELSEIRAAQREAGSPLGYDGRCSKLSKEEAATKLSDGQSAVIRLRVPRPGTTTVSDALREAIEFDNGQIDDQVLLKADGMPTYHLANVVDDHLMKISHVIRAEEWISSTPKHVLLYDAFGWDKPVFMHMPLLRNKDKSKISKRKNPVSINYYRGAGYHPKAMLNYLGMMGWSMPNGEEKFTLEDMLREFSPERISLGGPVFDVQKLTWLNGLYLREETTESLLETIKSELLSDDKLAQIIPLVHERMEKLDDFISQTAFFFVGDLSYDDAAMKAMVPKKRTPKEARQNLEALVEKIDTLGALTTETAEAALNAVMEENGLGPRDILLPTRIAVTGTKASPPLFETMGVLGKEKVRRRLRNAIAALKEMPS